MRKNLMFLALATIGLASCNGGYKKGENGLLYNIYIDKAGPKIKEGDFVIANLVQKNDADSVMFSTYDAGRPQPMILPKPEFKGDFFDGMKLLTEGDSASIKLSVDSIFKRNPKPPTFKGKYVIFDIKIEKVISKGTSTDQVFQSAVSNYMMQQSIAMRNAEPGKIKSFIADKKLSLTKTDSGLYYVITQKGTGPTIMAGDTAVVNYTGALLNGKVFDSNIKDDAIKAKLPLAGRTVTPIRFPVGQHKVIAGWDQGLKLLNKGAKATFIIPSSLAYGDQGNGPITPFAPVTFDVELVNIIHPNPNAPKPVAAQPAVNDPRLSIQAKKK